MNYSSCDYAQRLSHQLAQTNWDDVDRLGDLLEGIRTERRQLFICGNGGSAGNAIHLANDLLYGASLGGKGGFKVEALSANSSVITCLANDVGYDYIFSQQLIVKAQAGDMLIVLSGSGNSVNIVNALQTGNDLEMKTVAILGYSGGQCRNIAQFVIHFPVEDMQISEDLQLIVGHMCMQRLCA